MQPPSELRALIESAAAKVPVPVLRQATKVMSDSYRAGWGTAGIRLPDAERVATYLITRAPATYAAARRVMEEVPGEPATLLDAGAGAGCATLAVRDRFDLVATLIETDAALAAAGRKLLPQADWMQGDFRRIHPLPSRDLVIASYALAETKDIRTAMRLWDAARQTMVIIEPGTPRHFAFLRDLRERLLKRGAALAAPCPGEQPCPLAASDWCHFGARVERSSLHRRLKEGALNYEDEKFSYLVFTRLPATRAAGRILRRPAHSPGLVKLTVCRGRYTEVVDVTKRSPESFRAARNAVWGDAWNCCDQDR